MANLLRDYQGDGDWGLQSVCYHLLSHGISPSVNTCWTKDGPIYNKLWYPRKDGGVVFHAAQYRWEESWNFACLFSESHGDVSDNPVLPFRLQTRGTLTHEALLLLLNPKHIQLSEAKRAKSRDPSQPSWVA